jgi:apolipoprotein D and lipocalin family protein
MKNRFATALLGACLIGAVWAQQVQPVSHVDLNRYAGKWYEIARFPNRFQDDCVKNVTAEYSKRSDGNLTVLNRCTKADGSLDQASGEARVSDLDTKTNARLQVLFAPEWLSWIPFLWADYWIIDLTENYSAAVVGGPSRDYLWILSRQPHMPDADYEALVNRATVQGYDTSKLVKTRQE